MPERPRPDLDAVREAMRERDEDMPAEEESQQEPTAEDEEPEEDQ
jgi:hypothetical protein